VSLERPFVQIEHRHHRRERLVPGLVVHDAGRQHPFDLGEAGEDESVHPPGGAHSSPRLGGCRRRRQDDHLIAPRALEDLAGARRDDPLVAVAERKQSWQQATLDGGVEVQLGRVEEDDRMR